MLLSKYASTANYFVYSDLQILLILRNGIYQITFIDCNGSYQTPILTEMQYFSPLYFSDSRHHTINNKGVCVIWVDLCSLPLWTLAALLSVINCLNNWPHHSSESTFSKACLGFRPFGIQWLRLLNSFPLAIF